MKRVAGILLCVCALVSVSFAGCLSPNASYDYALDEATERIYTEDPCIYTEDPYFWGYCYDAEEGKKFYIINIKIVNNLDKAVSLDKQHWTIVADNVSYAIHYLTASDYIYYPEYVTKVPPDGSITFQLCFEIPIDSTEWSIVYDGPDDLKWDDSLL